MAMSASFINVFMSSLMAGKKETPTLIEIKVGSGSPFAVVVCAPPRWRLALFKLQGGSALSHFDLETPYRRLREAS